MQVILDNLTKNIFGNNIYLFSWDKIKTVQLFMYIYTNVFYFWDVFHVPVGLKQAHLNSKDV